MTPAVVRIATLGPIGHLRPGPGTWGSLAATLAAPVVFFPWDLAHRILLLAGAFALGVVCAGRAERFWGHRDPSCVVVDELVGQWIALLTTARDAWGEMLLAFALFRILDILKPWPIRIVEQRLPGGWGIMADDALAGAVAWGLLEVVRTFSVALA